MPCVVFSKMDIDDGGLDQKPIKRVTFTKQTQTGEIADLEMFSEWLKAFVSFERPEIATVLLASSTLYLKLNQLAAVREKPVEDIAKFMQTLRELKIYILFYSANSPAIEIESQIEDEFDTAWKKALEYSGTNQMRNLNTRLSFVTTLFETLRQVYQIDKNEKLVQELFSKLLGKYTIQVNCFVQSINMVGYYVVLILFNS